MALENPEYQEPLIKLVEELKPLTILEVGFGYGFSSTVWLEYSNARVTSIDKVPYGNVPVSDRFEFLLGDSKDILPSLHQKYDLIFIDGDHSYEGAKADIENALPLLAQDGILLLDDYGVVGVSGGANFDDSGNAVSGLYGVKQAADEVLTIWRRVYEDIKFTSGGRAYVKA